MERSLTTEYGTLLTIESGREQVAHEAACISGEREGMGFAITLTEAEMIWVRDVLDQIEAEGRKS